MNFSLLTLIYKIRHPKVKYEQIPYWYKRTLTGEIWHIIRKWICQVWAPNCTITAIRIGLYRLCGFKIGKGTFIGMKCYLDDLCVDKIEIGDNVIISYGVYFACHGPRQGHNQIIIRNNAYIGMRANIIAPHNIEIGERAVVGAQTLVNKSVPAGKTAVGIPCKILEK
jgi:acetyltransferase-like isoleucine patch superfamily enzyme